MRLRLLCIPAFFFLMAAPAGAQEAPAPQTQEPQTDAAAAPVFDVAAIHLHESQPHEHNSIYSSPSDGHFLAENISLIALIHWAYEMPVTRILGAPAWADATHFNIEAKANPAVDQQMRNLASDAGRHQKELMVQTLLADRFQLVTHIEMRELPIYELVAAKKGVHFGTVQETGSSVSTRNGLIEVRMSDSAAVLADELSKFVGRDVVDRTGITGRYDLKLQWTPDSPGTSVVTSGDPGLSIFTALQEQLGLRLVPAKGPVKVLVVDHIAQPSAN